MGEKPIRRKSKVSWVKVICSGLVGPKPRPKGVGDGEQVNIPAPPRRRLSEGGTKKGRPSGCWTSRFLLVGGSWREIRRGIHLRGGRARRIFGSGGVVDSKVSTKTSSRARVG